MLPSRLLVGLLVGPTVLSLGVLIDSRAWLAVLALDALVLAFALLDAALSRGRLLSIARHCPEVFSLGELNRVTLEVRSRANRPLSVKLNDDLFADASSPDLPLSIAIEPGATVRAEYQVVPRRRGAFELGDHFARYPSVLRLWVRQERLEAKRSVRVYPDLAMVRTFELLARTNREYALVRATRLRGGESEFARLRDYTRDDDYRSIDWKSTARRQKLTAREYQLESDQNVLFMLDAGRLMTARVGGLSQLDHALNASLMMAHVATRGGDKVGLMGFDEVVRSFVPPAGGRDASRRLILAAYDLHPKLVESDYDLAFSQIALRLRRRSLLVVFTQLVDDTAAHALARHLRALSRRHLPLVVLLRDRDLDAMAEGADLEGAPLEGDLYRRGAAAELLRWKSGVVKELERAGALVLETGAHRLTGTLINRYLEIKTRQLL